MKWMKWHYLCGFPSAVAWRRIRINMKIRNFTQSNIIECMSAYTKYVCICDAWMAWLWLILHNILVRHTAQKSQHRHRCRCFFSSFFSILFRFVVILICCGVLVQPQKKRKKKRRTNQRIQARTLAMWNVCANPHSKFEKHQTLGTKNKNTKWKIHVVRHEKQQEIKRKELNIYMFGVRRSGGSSFATSSLLAILYIVQWVSSFLLIFRWILNNLYIYESKNINIHARKF